MTKLECKTCGTSHISVDICVPEREHSRFGASTCERGWECSGSLYMIDRVLRLGHLSAKQAATTSIYAAEGTAAHEVASRILDAISTFGVETYSGNHDAWYGKTIHVSGHVFTVDTEMLAAIEVYIDHCCEILAYRPTSVFVETELRIPNPNTEGFMDDLFGLGDFGAANWDKLWAVDYKHGKGIKVAAHENKQLKYYLLGMWLALPKWQQDLIQTFEGTIVQPRSHEGDQIETSRYTREEMTAFHEGLIKAAARIKPNAPTKAGDWCKFCPAQLECPSFANKLSADAALDFAAYDRDSVAPMLPVINEMTPDRLAQIKSAESLVKSYFDQVNGRIETLLNQGTEVPGFKLVEKWGNRKWKNESDALATVVQRGIPADQCHKKTALSPNQFEELAKKLKIKGFSTADLTEKPYNGLGVEPIASSRPAATLAIAAQRDFDAIDVEARYEKTV